MPTRFNVLADNPFLCQSDLRHGAKRCNVSDATLSIEPMQAKLESKVHHGPTNFRAQATAGILSIYAPSYFAPAVPKALNPQDRLADDHPRPFANSC